MQLSKSSFQPLKNPPANADTLNHKLLVQAGFVRQLMAGVYTFLPLGLKTLNKIRNIIREEMDGLGGQELHMPALIPSKNLEQSGSWENVDILFKLKSQTKKNYGLGFSHEEVITPLAKEVINSYKDLPAAFYQIQWKFRDELRAKSGILRGREFEMKDMYSFHESQADFDKFYEKVKQAYLRAYKRVGLTAKVTEASGGNFTEKISYEFMVLTDAGEDDILYCPACEFCVNTEIAKVTENDNCPKCQKDKLKKARASEVGNVFDLGQKYSKDFDLKYMDKEGVQKYPIMGCYGWGTTRTMGVIVESFADDKGIVWPAAIAPFQVQLLSLQGAETKGQEIYDKLQATNIEVLWDDREQSAGSKFAAADLIGCPIRLVVSEKTADKIEWKNRNQAETKLLSLEEIIDKLKNK